MLKKSRPLSPHLTIYKPQITSVMSIAHRITGAFLYLGMVFICWIFFLCAYYPEILVNGIIWLNECQILRCVFVIVCMLWSLSLIYHKLNGIRHIFWDFGKGHDIKSIHISGKLVLILSLLLTLFIWYL